MSKHASRLFRSRAARTILVAASALALTGGSASVAAAARVPAGHIARSGDGDVRRACAVTHRQGMMSCMALVRTDLRPQPSVRGAVPVGFGYGPADLRGAYNLPFGGPAGEIVAVVDAYNDPTAVPDFNAYRAAWGLPACNAANGAGCLTVVNQNGAAAPLPPLAGATGWATEEALDVDMVAAVCPNCHVFLVEANAATTVALGTAVNSAVNAVKARFVSNSYGEADNNQDAVDDAMYYMHPGIVVTASAGDDGYGVSYPAASQFVVSAGGTTLTRGGGGARGWTETVWPGTGSGCSAFEAKPAWQHDPACAKRTDNDAAAVADPNNGVAVFDTYDEAGWVEVGGTSVSSPVIASVFALAGPIPAGKFGAQLLYAAAPAGLYDIVAGNNGVCVPPAANAYFCTAQVGYDGPTGLGTPNGLGAF
jgi:subtilase family serine protease